MWGGRRYVVVGAVAQGARKYILPFDVVVEEFFEESVRAVVGREGKRCGGTRLRCGGGCRCGGRV